MNLFNQFRETIFLKILEDIKIRLHGLEIINIINNIDL